jgi:hypothetical protein
MIDITINRTPTPEDPLYAISYGGGVQSTAMIVLAIQGKIKADVALFSNVGEDSEHPATLDYVRNIAIPWAASHGFPVYEIIPYRRGEPTTIVQEIMRPGSGRDIIPVYGDTGKPMSRTCTSDFKVKNLGKYLKQLGASKNNPAHVLIGISVDEIERANRGKNEPYEIREYPLLDLGLFRDDCMAIIESAGLPVPPKSSCFFCPFHKKQVWSELRRDHPDLFQKAQDLEDYMNVRNKERGRNPVYLTRSKKRLSDAIGEAQNELDFGSDMGEFGCDEGVCFV